MGHEVLIVGGGMVGCETADLLGEQGHAVSIVEMAPEIGRDVQDAVRYFLLRRLAEHKTLVYTNTVVKEFLEDSVRVEKDGREMSLTGFDTMIVAVGARPVRRLMEELNGKVKELHGIGDAVEARKAIDAIEEGAGLALKL